MPKVVRLFQDVAAPIQAFPPGREIAIAKFAQDIRCKITRWSSVDHFDYMECKVLGGIPEQRAADRLAEVLVSFLESELTKSKAGHVPGRTMITDLFDAACREEILYHPKLGLTNNDREFTRGSKLLIASVLDKALGENRYQSFKTPEVCLGIADFITGLSKDVVHYLDGLSESSHSYGLGMVKFTKKILLQEVIGQKHNEASAARQIMLSLIARDQSRIVAFTERNPG